MDKDGNKTAQSESARALLQGLLACGGAAASGNDCGSGALGAAGAVGLNNLLDALLKTDPEKMTAEEKLNRENLIGSIVAGIAEGTDSNANNALTGANTEMEHNYLKKPEVAALRDAQRMCSSGSAVACQKVKALEELSEERDKKVVQACAKGKQSTPQCKQVKNELLAAQDGLYRPGDLVGKLFTDKELKALEADQSQLLDALVYLSYTPDERKNIKLTAEQALIVRDLLVDFSIVGNVKDFNEAETAGDYGLAALGIVPFDKLLAVAKGIKTITKTPPVKDATFSNATKGSTNIWEKSGNFNDAVKDFESLKPQNIKVLPNGMRTGTLPDGRTVIVRPTSTKDVNNRVTLEFHTRTESGKLKIEKIRYE